MDNLGIQSGHPIFISLGNIPSFQQNKPEAKAIVGYLPVVKAQDIWMKNSIQFCCLQCTIYQQCWSIIIAPLKNQPDLYLAIQDQVVLCRLRISQILADMAETNKLTNVYQPSTTKRPCHSCLVLKSDLNNLHLSNVVYRTPSNMKQAIEMDEASEYSIHVERNIFWGIRYVIKTTANIISEFATNTFQLYRDFNIYQATVLDRMHILDLELFKYMLEYTKTLLLEQCGSQIVVIMEQ